MLDLVTATRLDGLVSTGKTRPLRLACERADGSEVDVVAKISDRCERDVGTLVVEAMAAMLAVDLKLPIPEPFLVKLLPEFIDAIADPETQADVRASSEIAFGSAHLPTGYAAWPLEKFVTKKLHQVAAEIFAFDGLIENVDRGQSRITSNCMVRGFDIAIIDHDLAFPDTSQLIGRMNPWEVGGLQHINAAGTHIFAGKLKKDNFNLSGFAALWKGLSDQRLNEFLSAIPPEWNAGIGAGHNAKT